MAASTSRDELLRTRVERFTRMLHEVKTGDVRAVHRTRVATRRLREVLPVLRLDSEVSEKLGRRLRKVTERLGPVRELDVLLNLIEELRKSGRYSTAALDRVAIAVRAERDKVRGRLVSKRAMNELARLANKLEKVTRALAEEKQSRRERESDVRARRWAIEARIARRASSVSAAMARAGAVYQPDRLHAVRIAVKKLRYAVEVATDASGGRLGAELRLLRRVQASLGHLHDLQVLLERVRRLQAGLAVPDLAVWRQLDSLVIALEDECRRLHARYMRDREALTALALRLAEGAFKKTEPAGRALPSRRTR